MDKNKNIQAQTSNWFVDRLSLYQSANTDNSSIKNNFVIRKAEFEIIISDLKNKSGEDPLQHELILGRRGSGKSTLLRRIQAEIEENKTLQIKYIAINLAEEQAGIYRLSDLWEEVIKELAATPGKPIQVKAYSEFKSDHEYSRYLFDIIHETLVKQQKKVVLLLDNFDRIVGNFTDDGHLLREILLNFSDIQLIAGSTRMDEHFWQYDQPFYEFFRRHRLEALSTKEIVELLNHWSNVMQLPQLAAFAKNNIGKIEAIRILTDGLPRTLQFFIQILLQNSDLYGYEYLRKVMDNVTTLYQERLNNLPAAQRKIIAEMAFIWEACATKELVEKCRMESKLISANVKQLSNAGIIDTITTDKKNHLYRISERFFNMWLIVTQGNPDQKRKAKWLSIFLESWYDAAELTQLAIDHIGNLKNKQFAYDKALVFTKAFAQSRYITTMQRDELIDLTMALQPKGSDFSLLALPKKYADLEIEIKKLIGDKKLDHAHELVAEIENEEDGIKFFIKGYIFQLEKNFPESEKNYILAIEKGHVNAINNLANLYCDHQRFSEAEKYFQLSIEKGDVKAYFNLATLYNNLKRFEEAEKYFLIANEKGDIGALNNLAVLFIDLKRFEEAEKYFLIAIEKGDVAAIYNLAILYKDLKRFEEAEKYFLIAIEKEQLDALNNLASLYYDQRRFEEAEKYFLIAIENGGVLAFNNLAMLYYEQNNKTKNALELISAYNSTAKGDILGMKSQIIIETWNGIFEDLNNRILAIIKESSYDNLNWFFTQLLIQEQLNLVFNLFTDAAHGTELQKRYLPLYYAIMLLNNKTENNLALRIPPEIMPTVNDMMGTVKAKQKFYRS